ncbi:MAG: ribonuclease D [Anaerolineae bacterium]|jgi:ribonuclease D|nr:ribonuclease D [Anaerolineae bacterium]MDH7473717.1 HRDC domain-containing protein [Anaerolineae bacterium]
MTAQNSTINPILVDTPQALARTVARLQAEPAVAVDTESNSFYVYHEQVCLIQFSIPGQDFLVDSLAISDLNPLAPLFADAGIEKVFHAAEYDVMCLKRDFGFQFVNLFDTMIAARILGWKRYGLGSILEEHFGVQQDKRLQRANWGQRPLSPEQLQYAALDTHYLLPLRDILRAELQARRREREAREAFAALPALEWTKQGFDPNGFWHIKGVHDLSPAGQAVLRELYLYRDEQARSRNLPPFKVLSNAVLIHLSERRPTTIGELRQVKGITQVVVKRYGRGLLDAIRRGWNASPPRLPERPPRPQNAVLERYEALRRWRKRRAEARGVEPDVLISNETLFELAKRAPQDLEALAELDLLGPWKLETYGTELLAVLRRRSR